MPITIPSHLTDVALIAEVGRCARDERRSTAQLVAHLAELDARGLYLGAGYSSLFSYCREVLALSEDAAYNRVEAARACRMFPTILDGLADGSLTVTTVRRLARLLTAENHRELLAAAARRSKREVEELIARRFPKPDVPASVRKVPVPTTSPSITWCVEAPPAPLDTIPRLLETPPSALDTVPMPLEPLSRPAAPLAQRAAVKPLAADRYEVRFTASAETRNKLKVAQDLLRHAVPGGDLAAIFDRALDALIERLSREKLAIVRKPRAASPPLKEGTRHVPSSVRRAVWVRDRGRCAFASPAGRRCGERAFLEYHHVKPFAVGGEATVANVQLRCRAHNGHEADLFFGTGQSRGGAGVAGEWPAKYSVSWESSPVPERASVVRERASPSRAIPG